jgi:hypothetical protein
VDALRFGGPPAAEARQREVEGAQKKCTGLDLPRNRPLKRPRIRDACRSVWKNRQRGIGVVGRVLMILGERGRGVHLDGNGPDLDRDVEAAKRVEVLGVEVRHAPRPQRQVSAGSIARGHDEAVIDEVERDLERPRADTGSPT